MLERRESAEQAVRRASTVAERAQIIREKCRDGTVTKSTSGLATTMQANLIVIPKQHAKDLRNLCVRNPVPCPLLEVIPAGIFTSHLAEDSDLRTDLPAYNIYEDGELKDTVHDVQDIWSKDHVGFVIGCSYSFETALAEAGLKPKSMRENKAVPMFTTNIPLNPSGIFTKGYYVVSMRSYKERDLERVREITARFVKQHGEPIAWGWDGAERIGIRGKVEKGEPDFGDSLLVPEDEIPIFWGCGVTPQVAVKESKLKGIVVSHKPGSMFVTDLEPDDEESLKPELLDVIDE